MIFFSGRGMSGLKKIPAVYVWGIGVQGFWASVADYPPPPSPGTVELLYIGNGWCVLRAWGPR